MSKAIKDAASDDNNWINVIGINQGRYDDIKSKYGKDVFGKKPKIGKVGSKNRVTRKYSTTARIPYSSKSDMKKKMKTLNTIFRENPPQSKNERDQKAAETRRSNSTATSKERKYMRSVLDGDKPGRMPTSMKNKANATRERKAAERAKDGIYTKADIRKRLNDDGFERINSRALDTILYKSCGKMQQITITLGRMRKDRNNRFYGKRNLTLRMVKIAMKRNKVIIKRFNDRIRDNATIVKKSKGKTVKPVVRKRKKKKVFIEDSSEEDDWKTIEEESSEELYLPL